MDGSGQRDNGRHKQDLYKGIHTQWMMNTSLLTTDALSMKFMTIRTERDTALQERDLAMAEKKAAVAERDMAILQRDAAISERNNALMERDNAIAAYEYRENSTINGSNVPMCPQGCAAPRGMKLMHRVPHIHQQSHFAESPNHAREMHISEAFPIAAAVAEPVKSRKSKRVKEVKAVLPNKPSKRRKNKRANEDLNMQITLTKLHEWSSGEGLNKHLIQAKSEWKDQDLGLNQVTFDDSSMPAPVCTCTGVVQQCYKWGNGGWQSACCTTTISMYPLPVMPNKRHARIGGRKMSGSVFTRLLSRLASEGHDLSTPLDLKDHWAKHGTNRYITIR